MTKFTVKVTTQFRKDYKLAIKRGLKIDLWEQTVASLADGIFLPEKNKDHALTGILKLYQSI
jgi:mRNA interferase YafQ